MTFIGKLFVFAAGLVAIMGVWRVGKLFTGDRDHAVEMAEAPERPEAPPRPELPERPEVVGAEAAQVVVTDANPDVAQTTRVILMSPLEKGEVRIMTVNGAGFLSLRNDDLVAGFSDSLVQAAKQEMAKEMQSGSDGGKLGEFIKDAVQSGVSKVLSHRVSVPVSEIRDIEYRRNRIVIDYKRDRKKELIDFEGLKTEGDTPFLASFNEEESKRLVQAVRARIK